MTGRTSPQPPSRFLPRIQRAFRRKCPPISAPKLLSEAPTVHDVPPLKTPSLSNLKGERKLHHTQSSLPRPSRETNEMAELDSNVSQAASCSPSSSSASWSAPSTPCSSPMVRRHRGHDSTFYMKVCTSVVMEGAYAGEYSPTRPSRSLRTSPTRSSFTSWSDVPPLGQNTLLRMTERSPLSLLKPKSEEATPSMLIPRLVVSSFEERAIPKHIGPPASVLMATAQLKAFLDGCLLDIFMDECEGDENDENGSPQESSVAFAFPQHTDQANMYPNVLESAIGIAL